MHQWVCSEPLCPVDQVAIIGTGLSPHLDMSGHGSRGMPFEDIACGGFELPSFVVVHRPILSHNPVHILVGVSPSCPGAQGQVEGQITRRKFLKRQMYGRAHFDLLRSRVLRRA